MPEVKTAAKWVPRVLHPRQQCRLPHPVNGRPCEEPKGHVWNHAYGEERIRVGSRIWWDDDGSMRDLGEVNATIDAHQQLDLWFGQ